MYTRFKQNKKVAARPTSLTLERGTTFLLSCCLFLLSNGKFFSFKNNACRVVESFRCVSIVETKFSLDDKFNLTIMCFAEYDADVSDFIYVKHSAYFR